MGKYIKFIKRDYNDELKNDLSELEYSQIIYSLENPKEVEEFIKERINTLKILSIDVKDNNDYLNMYKNIIINIIKNYPYFNCYTLMNDLAFYNKSNNILFANSMLNILGYQTELIERNKNEKYLMIKYQNKEILYDPALRINYKDDKKTHSFAYFKVLTEEEQEQLRTGKKVEINPETTITIINELYNVNSKDFTITYPIKEYKEKNKNNKLRG